MKGLDAGKAPSLFIDIGQSGLHAVCGGDAFAFPIERGENGKLTDLCRERLIVSLRGFAGQKGSSARGAVCAISARGVSMRRLALPASTDEELGRVLRLQIESEFPISPDELAWGSRKIGAPIQSANGGPARQELLVIAVKKEVIAEYSSLLEACGLRPVFTLGALARAQFHATPGGTCAVLDIGRTHSELLTLESGVPSSIRVLSWGGESITRSIQEKLVISHDEAEKLKLAFDQAGALSGPQGPLIQEEMEAALTALGKALKTAPIGTKIFLTGKSVRNVMLAPHLAALLGNAVACESLPPTPAEGPSAVIEGLKKSAGSGLSPLIYLQSDSGSVAVRPPRPAVFKWAIATACLALAALCFPFAEAIVCKPFLQNKLAALEADRGRLPMIDEELDFLKFVKQSQLPCLDVIYLLARCSPGGTQIENLSMGRHQEITFRLKLNDNQQVSDFRSKLIETGWFNNVMVEEQTPSPDRRMNVRMSAALNPPESRKPIPSERPGKKKENLPEGQLAQTTAPPMATETARGGDEKAGADTNDHKHPRKIAIPN